MSLILDALRQAEQERGRDRAPDLFGQTIGATPPLPASAPLARWPWTLAGVGVLALAAALAWTQWPRPAAMAGAPQAAAPQQPAGPTDGTPLFNPPAAAPAKVDQPQAPPPAAAAPPLPAPASATPALPVPIPPVVSSPPMPPATPATTEAQVPSATELPSEVRARLPGLNITGHTYSDNPTLRTLMIDGRMFVEGQAVQPGLRVERIGPHRAVFNHQGTRFGVDY
jgi:general secretion pathway protein B